MNKLYNYQLSSNYFKTLARLQKSLRSGKFANYTQQKKHQVWNRLCRYARQLGLKVKAPLAAACLAAGLGFATPATAQTFAVQTGAANPFNAADVGDIAAPILVDIDADGDLDAFIGAYDGTISYYKNTGTATAPVLTVQTGAANPFDGVMNGNFSSPAFVDIDGDGDLDALIGQYYGTISYYKNTGTASVPAFSQIISSVVPFNGVDIGYYSAPTFVDIDGDGDMDAFSGEDYGAVFYFKNTGTATAPVLTMQTGAANPLDGVDVGYVSTPTFVDIDGDGDMDALIGAYDGTVKYYKNTGTATAPVFTLQTGSADPFNSLAVPGFSKPAFADIDGDGDQDVFIGSVDGTISYYKNNDINLPLHLISFSGNRQSGYNHLQWQTAAELNTQRFEIEMSSDGHNFIKIASVITNGSGSNSYSINDNAAYNGKIFYRLKMVDVDGRFTYSQIIWIKSSQPGNVSLYPNPVRDIMNINIGNANILKTHAGIFDGNGRLLQDVLINNYQQQINVQSFAKGFYQIKFADGTTQSFIKE